MQVESASLNHGQRLGGERSDVVLLDTRQVARELGLCTKSVQNLIRDKRLRALKIGRSVRVRRSDLVAFLDSTVTV